MSCTGTPSGLAFRTAAQATDVESVKRIAASTGFFSAQELAIAVELIEDRLGRGTSSDYQFVFAEHNGQMIGFACFGQIPGTQSSMDLYWIAVRDDQRGKGIGRALLYECERVISALRGRRIYVETSSRTQYEPTRQFYRACGYRVEATLDDYYAPGDGLVILLKVLKAV